MTSRVMVVNGGSSSRKTSIVRQSQEVLPEPWLAVSIDDFVTSLPPALQHSPAAVTEQREGSRPDRDVGMAADQTKRVHQGVVYDVEVDTTRSSAQECARTILATLELD